MDKKKQTEVNYRSDKEIGMHLTTAGALTQAASISMALGDADARPLNWQRSNACLQEAKRELDLNWRT